jgi:hypothetical protein
MSDDVGNEYFSDGVSEELLNQLSKIPELRVISRSSSFAFKGEKTDIPTVAKKLNVCHIPDVWNVDDLVTTRNYLTPSQFHRYTVPDLAGPRYSDQERHLWQILRP